MTLMDLGPPGPGTVVAAPPLLAEFNAAGVLGPADVHAAVTVGRLLGERRPEVLLAAALAVRGTRFGHVRVDLADVQSTVVVDGVDPEAVQDLPWPEPGTWPVGVAGSPLVTAVRPPLVLVDTALYLMRYRDYEQFVGATVQALAASEVEPPPGFAEALGRLVGDAVTPVAERQRLAIATAALQRLTVVVGGPGTGKTTTAGWFLALLMADAHRRDVVAPAIALGAPTGKAAARLTEAIRYAAEHSGLPDAVRSRMLELEGMTLHRLLGWHPGRGRFRHGPETPLPHDVVLVDEVSMVSLPMAAKLLGALRPEARLILVGDPDQLVSIEAGTVLGDIVGPAADGEPRFSARARKRLEPLVGPVPSGDASSGLADNVVMLTATHRFPADSSIARFAGAVRSRDADGALDVLRRGGGDLVWVEPGEGPVQEVPAIQQVVDAHLQVLLEAAGRGDVTAALDEVRAVAVLCAHRRGPRGVAEWVRYCADRVQVALGGRFLPTWYAGRPVMVTSNDYYLGLFNGDIGVTMKEEHGLAVAFPGLPHARRFGPAQLSDIDTVYAMTIHKSQGSEFGHVVVVLPEPDSPLATRELLYTAVTRATERVTLVGSEESVRASIGRSVARASGLGDRLWVG